MDISVWLGVAFFLLSIPMGIATNVLTPRFISYLEHRKLIKSNRTKEQDIAAYRNIETFKNGTRDKYAYYILLAVLSVGFALLGTTGLLLLTIKYLNWNQIAVLLTPPHVFVPILMLLSFLLSFLMLIIISTTARRIERFDEYTAEIRKKWGEDAV